MNLQELINKFQNDPVGLQAFLDELRNDDEAAHRLVNDWRFLARPSQIEPEGDWSHWVYCGGRGSGKTRAGAEWVREQIKSGVEIIHLIGPTTSDLRDVMIRGPSGILSVCKASDKDIHGNLLGYPDYIPTTRLVRWANGARALAFSAEQPDRLRGPQCHRLWADELAAWRAVRETWDNAIMGLRLPDRGRPRAMVTTTPRPISLLRELIKMESTVVTKSTTWENAANLSPDMIAELRRRYAGTRIGQQELEGEILEDFPNALWTMDMFELHRRPDEPRNMRRRVVAIDPAGSGNWEEGAGTTGIVAAGMDETGQYGYVLGDYTIKGSPTDWARQAIMAYEKHRADCIVVEKNYGGPLVAHTIATINRNIPVRTVWAAEGKHIRAEPISALYQQNRIWHVGEPDAYRELEDELIKFTTDGYQGKSSPNRADSLVWACTELFFPASKPSFRSLRRLVGLV